MDFFKENRVKIIKYSFYIWIIYLFLPLLAEFNFWTNYFSRIFVLIGFLAITCWILNKFAKYFYKKGKNYKERS